MSRHEPGLEYARRLDADDPLSAWREAFHIPETADGGEAVYLCGNSLGLQPRRTPDLIEEELEDWRRLAVAGHLRARRPWMPYHEELAAPGAALVGAKPSEVVYMNGLTVNLHLMMVSFFRPEGTRSGRRKILIERPAFPSDRYAAESQLRFHGLDPADALLEIGPRDGEDVIRMEDLAALIEREGPEIALVLLPGVQYYSGQAFDMAGVTRLAHAAGCVVGFDLAHAAGNLELALHDWDVDFAAWCSYKYLNAGPGSAAGCFVNERHARAFQLPRFAGWWGHDKDTRFRMGPDFVPMAGAEGWQLSNPPILAMAPVLASLQVFAEAGGMGPLRERSERLTGYLEWLLAHELAGRVEVLTPAEPAARGAQLSLRVRGPAGTGRKVQERLEGSDVICDFREPDVIRVAPTPLYNRFADCWRLVEVLGEVLTVRPEAGA